MWLRGLLLLLMLTVSATAQQADTFQHADEGEAAQQGANMLDRKIRVGVRSSARPFSYRTAFQMSEGRPRSITPKSGPLRYAGYDGYMIYICDEVLKQMLIPEDHTPPLSATQVTHVDIDDLMRDRPREDRMGLLGVKIDILCDPASIDRERVRQYTASLPLFVTGVGFLQRQGELGPRGVCTKDKALIGAVGTTNAVKYGVRAILRGQEWKNYREAVELALNAPDGGTADCKNIPGKISGIIWTGSTHEQVARHFCEGDVFYYVGDLEIITEHARQIAGCDFTTTPESFTNDRYGIYASIDYSDKWKALRIGRFFEILNREVITSDSLLDRAYLAEFGERARSPRLEAFFSSIRGTP